MHYNTYLTITQLSKMFSQTTQEHKQQCKIDIDMFEQMIDYTQQNRASINYSFRVLDIQTGKKYRIRKLLLGFNYMELEEITTGTISKMSFSDADYSYYIGNDKACNFEPQTGKTCIYVNEALYRHIMNVCK